MVLMKKRVKKDNKKYTTFGIQGARGSFCEEAVNKYIEENGIKNPKIKYLYTSEKVLTSLFKKDIDYGICALHNSVGGVVTETLYAVARHKCDIVCEFNIIVRHFLMKKKGVDTKSITHIMAHPQVFLQCKSTLKKKYPELETLSGKGDLVDTAKAGEALAKGTLPETYAILGSKSIADLYNLEIIDKDLQDSHNNLTAFVVLKRMIDR